jgi:predicted amidohydrolase YtcJ
MLYANATIITVNKSREITLNGAILVEGNKIAELGKTDDLKTKYSHEEIVDLSGRIVIPGLVSTHMHTAQNAYCADFVARFASLSILQSYPKTYISLQNT